MSSSLKDLQCIAVCEVEVSSVIQNKSTHPLRPCRQTLAAHGRPRLSYREHHWIAPMRLTAAQPDPWLRPVNLQPSQNKTGDPMAQLVWHCLASADRLPVVVRIPAGHSGVSSATRRKATPKKPSQNKTIPTKRSHGPSDPPKKSEIDKNKFRSQYPPPNKEERDIGRE